MWEQLKFACVLMATGASIALICTTALMLVGGMATAVIWMVLQMMLVLLSAGIL